MQTRSRWGWWNERAGTCSVSAAGLGRSGAGGPASDDRTVTARGRVRFSGVGEGVRKNRGSDQTRENERDSRACHQKVQGNFATPNCASKGLIACASGYMYASRKGLEFLKCNNSSEIADFTVNGRAPEGNKRRENLGLLRPQKPRTHAKAAPFTAS